jgi:hypothetical protein
VSGEQQNHRYACPDTQHNDTQYNDIQHNKKSNAKHNSNIVLSVVDAKWCIFVSIASLVTMLNVVMLGNKKCEDQNYDTQNNKKSDAKHNCNIMLSVVYAKWCIVGPIKQLVITVNVVMLGNKICDEQHYTFGQGTLY